MNAAQNYRTHAVSTQDSGKLVVMLYDGAVKFLKIAEEKLAEGDFETKGIYVGKAQDIVAELNNCLDLESGGELAQNLQALYNFVHRRLSSANAKRDSKEIRQCRDLLVELRDAWKEIADNKLQVSDGPQRRVTANQQA